MATVMKMRWEGVTSEQYEELRPTVRWEAEPPEGIIFHVAWFRDGGITVVDVWESQEAFERFFLNRLKPGMEQIGGFEGEPEVRFFEAHAYFNPALQRV